MGVPVNGKVVGPSASLSPSAELCGCWHLALPGPSAVFSWSRPLYTAAWKLTWHTEMDNPGAVSLTQESGFCCLHLQNAVPYHPRLPSPHPGTVLDRRINQVYYSTLAKSKSLSHTYFKIPFKKDKIGLFLLWTSLPSPFQSG